MAEEQALSDILEPVEALRLENEKLKLLTDGDPPTEILVVSDLHLGRGREPETRRFVRTENFVSDQAFGRWVYAMQPDKNKLLVLNGDTFDFIRICNCPGTAQDFAKWSALLARLGAPRPTDQLEKAISNSERRYGLQTEDYKCVWKLLQIAEGHQEFFRALAHWVEAGGSLLMGKGNHDLDIYWPLVRKAFCAFLKDQGASKQSIEQRVFYCDSWIRIRNIYFEHGHQYDSQQKIEGPPTLPERPLELNLPLATFVARYLVNQLEKQEPFLGSIRPTERILWIILRRHPIAGIAVLARSLRFIRRAAEMSKVRDSFWYIVFFATVALPLITFVPLVLIIFFPQVLKWMTVGVRTWAISVGVIGMLAPYIAAALREFLFFLNDRRPPPIGEDAFAQGVYKTMQKMQFSPATRIYAVMGHTHDQDIQSLPEINGAKVLYLNTGSWIPVWPEDRPDLAGQVLYPFVHFKLHPTSEYHHFYAEWRDDRGHAAEAYILAPISRK